MDLYRAIVDILKYKEYEGTADVDVTRGVCRGKILFIDDLVTYEAESPRELVKEFESAVDDYIETCAVLKRTPQKPLKGLFNVRVTPALHRAAALRALNDNVSLNEVVVRALDTYVIACAEVKHNHNLQVTVTAEENVKTLVSSVSATTQWKKAVYAH